MSAILPYYKKIKDNYGISYYGNDISLINKLIHIKSLVENNLPGINLYIICNDEYENLFNDKQFFIKKSDVTTCNKFITSCYREVKSLDDIELLLKESKE